MDLPLVKLDEVLVQNTDYIEPEPRMYPKLSVKLYGKGVVIDTPADGATLKMKRHQLAKPGQVILSEIWGKKGAIGLVPPEGEGALCTSHFYLFDVVREKIDPDWLRLIFTANYLECQLGAEARGTTGYASIRPKTLLSCEIPLPSLDEQRRIVTRIENVSQDIAVAMELLNESHLEVKAILQSALFEIFVRKANGWKRVKLSSVVAICDKQVDPTLPEYQSLPHISGENMESGTCRLLPYRTAGEDGVRSGNYLFGPDTVLYSKIRPYLRKAVYVPFEGVCSAEVYPIRCVNGEIAPEFLKWALISQPFTDYANKLSGRTRMPKLNRKQLGNFEISYPSMDAQIGIARYLDDLQAKNNIIEKLQGHRMEEMQALMPSILDKAFRGEL
jgi:type I restriction enzyme S subunit